MNPIGVVIFAGFFSVVYDVVTSSNLLAPDAGSPHMQEIAGAIGDGMALTSGEYHRYFVRISLKLGVA